jgi:hypothetical protein
MKVAIFATLLAGAAAFAPAAQKATSTTALKVLSGKRMIVNGAATLP